MPRVSLTNFPTTPNSGPSLTLGTELNNRFNALAAAANGANSFRLDWLNTAAYVANDVVRYNASFWIALADNTNSAPATNNAAWAQWQALASSLGANGASVAVDGFGNINVTLPASRSFRINGLIEFDFAGNYISSSSGFYIRNDQAGFYMGVGDDTRFYRSGINAIGMNGSLFVQSANSQGFGIRLAPTDGSHIPFLLDGAANPSTPLIQLRHRSSTNAIRAAVSLDAVVTNSSDANFTADFVIWTAKNAAMGARAKVNDSGLVMQSGCDIEITDVTKGVILRTPDGTKRARLTLNNDLSLQVTAI